MFSAEDYQHMARAIQLAKRPVQAPHPNPRVGCVIVKNGLVIGQGFHHKAGQAHAEVNALKDAGNEAIGATVYVTLEPCAHTGKTPPCAEALIKAKVKKVIVAMVDPNPKVAGKGMDMLQEAGIQTASGLLQDQAENLNLGFIKRMRTGLPWVRCKIAMSVDGRTAMANGESQWITGPAARQDVQYWRANADAIVTGSGTVIADDPRLTVRDIPVDEIRQPVKVVVDGQLKVSPNATLFSQSGRVILASLAAANESNYSKNASFLKLSEKNGHVDLAILLKELGGKEINEVHLEAGARLNDAFLVENLVDEIVIYAAPSLMGHQARPIFLLENIHSMKDQYLLECTDIRHVGKDIRFIYRKKHN